jgi:hypothetical protein
VKSRDQIERELARIILDACQAEQDATAEFMLPSGTLPDLLPAERATAANARHAVGISDRVWDAELRHFLFVREIIAGTRKTHRRSA